ncbi:MAG TPA: PAS domain-containing protein, partial [Candidatus Methanoperedens sp.]
MNKDRRLGTRWFYRGIRLRRTDIFWIVLAALVYFIVARFSLTFIFKPEGIAAIWPLTGFFLSSVLLARRDVRPYLIATLLFTDFIAEMLAGTPYVASLLYAAILSGDAILGSWLMIRFVGEPVTFQKTRDIFGFLLLTVFLSNALMSVLAALTATIYLAAPFWLSWFLWFSSDGVGSLLVTPFIISFAYSFRNKFREFKSYQVIEASVLFISMGFLNYYAFSRFMADSRFMVLLTLFTFPFLIWASLRLGIVGTGAATIILAMIVLFNTVWGEFPQIAMRSTLETIIFVQIYIAVMSLPSILLASLITERKQAEEKLRDSESRLNKSQEIAHLGSWVVDIQANRLIWSDETYRILGLQPAELNPTYEGFLEIVHPEDRALVDAAYSNSLLEGRDSYDIEHRIVRKHTGETRYVHERCEHIRDASGTIIRSLGMVQDITERRKTEEEVRLNSEIFKNVSEGINLVGMGDGIIKHVNSKLEQMFGYRPGELIGKDVSILNAPTDKKPQEIKNAIMDSIRRNGEWHGEVKNIRKDGTP